MEYLLEMDDEGRRYWQCRHPNGEVEDLPPGVPIQFNADLNQDGDNRLGLPVGTRVKMEIPKNAAAYEEASIRRVLRNRLRKAAELRGHSISDTDMEKFVNEKLKEFAEGSEDPAIRRMKENSGARTTKSDLIVPGDVEALPSYQQFLDAVDGSKQ